MKAVASIFLILILAMVAISLWVNLANAAPLMPDVQRSAQAAE